MPESTTQELPAEWRQYEEVGGMSPRESRQQAGIPQGTVRAVEVLDASLFLKMLCLERKRTERSARPFVLMLVESKGVEHNGQGSLLDRVQSTLSRSTRETDIKGWHEAGAVFGVILTEIGLTEARTVAQALRARMMRVLGQDLGQENIGKVRITFHLFPDEEENGGTIDVTDSPLFPDVTDVLNQRTGERLIKRGMDIAGSLSALVVLAPVFLVVAAAVKLSSKGPVLFRQERVGQFGRTFEFLKFRSMVEDNDPSEHRNYVTQMIAGSKDSNQSTSEEQVYKLKNDRRITSVGRILRRTSLDELPQFYNVLRGDMSLVGPRPPIPYEVECYHIWQKRRLLTVKPGITGPWQVGGRSRIKFDEMVRLDLRYAQSWTLWTDMKILLKTPRAALTGL